MRLVLGDRHGARPWSDDLAVTADEPLTAQQRVLRARIASHASWANTEEREQRTRTARDRAWARFEDMVDPDKTMDPVERQKRAESGRKAYFSSLALKSAKARAKRKKER